MDTSTTTCFCVLCAPFGGKRLTVKTTWEHANRMFAQGFQPTDYRWLQQFVPLKSTPTRVSVINIQSVFISTIFQKNNH